MRREEASAFDEKGIPVTTTWVFLEREEYHDLMDDMDAIYGDNMSEQVDTFRGARHIPLLRRNEITEPVFNLLEIETDFLSVCQEGMDHTAISIWAGVKREREEDG